MTPEPRYSLRTCAIIIGVAVAISWAPFIGLWFWLKPAGGFSMADMPPKEYQGNARMSIHFTNSAKLMCAIVKAPAGSIACANEGWAIMPNPCGWREQYAVILCHEKGHANGWPAGHPK